MSIEKRDQSNEIPENDLLDQATPIDPNDAVEPFEGSRVDPAAVSEADWVDQQIPVPLDDPEREEE